MATHSSPYDWADTNFARRSILTANAVALGSNVSDLPARFRLPRAADAGTEPDVLGESLSNRNDVVFYDTSGTLLKWEFTNPVTGVGFLKWPTLTALLLTDAILSGLLQALGVADWRLHRGVEVNPVLRWLADLWAADGRWRWGWAGYWAVWIALCWVLPEPWRTWYCIAASAASLFGIGSIIYARLRR